MSQLEPRIEAIRVKYDLKHDDFWQIKQNGQWVCKHSALEVVAFKANVEWLPPQILEMDAPRLVTSMVVTGKMGDRVEWATGETNETNYSVKGKQPAYPWAMSEKRGKDRVILKLVGLHGLVYSDAEADAFIEERAPEPKQEPSTPKPKQKTVAERKAIWAQLMDDLKAEAPKGWRKMVAYMENVDTKAAIEELGDYKKQFLDEARELTKLAKAGEEASGEPVAKVMSRVLPSFDHLDTSPTPDAIEELLERQGDYK